MDPCAWQEDDEDFAPGEQSDLDEEYDEGDIDDEGNDISGKKKSKKGGGSDDSDDDDDDDDDDEEERPLKKAKKVCGRHAPCPERTGVS